MQAGPTSADRLSELRSELDEDDCLAHFRVVQSQTWLLSPIPAKPPPTSPLSSRVRSCGPSRYRGAVWRDGPPPCQASPISPLQLNELPPVLALAWDRAVGSCAMHAPPGPWPCCQAYCNCTRPFACCRARHPPRAVPNYPSLVTRPLSPSCTPPPTQPYRAQAGRARS